jgi:hypothetical protein
VPMLTDAVKRRLQSKAVYQQFWHLAPSADCFTL